MATYSPDSLPPHASHMNQWLTNSVSYIFLVLKEAYWSRDRTRCPSWLCRPSLRRCFKKGFESAGRAEDSNKQPKICSSLSPPPLSSLCVLYHVPVQVHYLVISGWIIQSDPRTDALIGQKWGQKRWPLHESGALKQDTYPQRAFHSLTADRWLFISNKIKLKLLLLNPRTFKQDSLTLTEGRNTESHSHEDLSAQLHLLLLLSMHHPQTQVERLADLLMVSLPDHSHH